MSRTPTFALNPILEWGASVISIRSGVRRVMRPYLDILALPGALRFSSMAFLARMPMAMLVIGIVVVVEHSSGSYGVAGAVAGTFSLAAALAAPRIARWADVAGQRQMLRPVSLVQATFTALLVLCAELRLPAATLFAAAAGMGLSAPFIGSLVRARWSYVVTDARGLHTAYSLESVLDEIVLMIGPVLVTASATLVAPAAGLVMAVVFRVVGGMALAAQVDTEPPKSPRRDGTGLSLLRIPQVQIAMVASAGAGGVFGSMQVAVVVFAEAEGRPGVAGLLLALGAVGSLCAGLAFGALHWQAPLARRYSVVAAAFAAGAVAYPVAASISVLLLATVIFLSGATGAPLLITVNAIIRHLAPADRLTEGLTWATTGLLAGHAAGAAAAGQLVDGVGVQSAFVVTAVSGVMTLAAAAAVPGGEVR